MCFTRSSSTAARATSANCPRSLACDRAPGRASDWPIVENLQLFLRLLYRMRVCGTVVASTSLPCKAAMWNYGTPSKG